jgi:cell division protein FtsI/penicillin-binding protein 2
MRESLNRRLGIVGVIMLTLVGLITYRLVSLQFGIDTAYFAETALTEYRYQVTLQPPRGEVYDRNGILLATNAIDYEIGMSPVLIYDRQRTAELLSEATGLTIDELLEDLSSPAPYVQLVRPAPATMGQRVLELDLDGVVVSPLPRRYYPHSTLASHVLGFVALDNTGYYGIEGFYDDTLRGRVEVNDQSRIPFEATGGEGWQSGQDLYLTIDSEIQYLAERVLENALFHLGAESGTIIVMQPRTGEILAMANLPSYDPNLFATHPDAPYENVAIGAQYEPGSVVKALTMAIGLENGVVQPGSTYNDLGILEVAGAEIVNWDRAAHGVTTMTDLLGKSLNVGAAWLSLQIGPIDFYEGLDRFGLGQRTGIDLQGEIRGTVRRPGNADWYEADLATNAFGQGMAVTPLQMIVSMGAIANDGLLMQPRMVDARVAPDGTITQMEPSALGRAISPETAGTLSLMLADALRREASKALVPGYTIAGKTGTSEIPIPGGYDPEATIASFVGYGPVDDPQFIVLVKLDRPTYSRWGSDTAAPVFRDLVTRLVVLMEIPPDDVRRASAGLHQ